MLLNIKLKKVSKRGGITPAPVHMSRLDKMHLSEGHGWQKVLHCILATFPALKLTLPEDLMDFQMEK